MRQYSFHLALLLLSETFLLSSLYLYFSFPYDFSSLISFFLFQSSFFTLWRGWIPSGSTRALSLRSDLRTSASATSASWLKDEFVFLVAVISSLSFVNSVSSIFFEPLTSDPADLPSSFESDPDYHSRLVLLTERKSTDGDGRRAKPLTQPQLRLPKLRLLPIP